MMGLQIPTRKVATIKGEECQKWLAENTQGRVLGRRYNGVYIVAFEEVADAEAFRRRWLNR